MEHGLLEDAKAHEKAHKAFMKRKTAPNTKSSIAGVVQPRRYLDEIENKNGALGGGGKGGEAKSEVKKETPSARKPTPPASAKKPNESSAMKKKPKVEDQNEESSDDDVPLAKLAAAQKA